MNYEILKYIDGKDTKAYYTYDSGSEREQIFNNESFRIGVDNI